MKIQEDEHGLFVRVNGAVHRPLPSVIRHVGTDAWTGKPFDITVTEKGPQLIDGQWRYVLGVSHYKAGDDIKVKNINYTPYSNVGGELWTTHGQGWRTVNGKTKKVPSTECFYNGQIYQPQGTS
jgi:hypothetical protein